MIAFTNHIFLWQMIVLLGSRHRRAGGAKTAAKPKGRRAQGCRDGGRAERLWGCRVRSRIPRRHTIVRIISLQPSPVSGDGRGCQSTTSTSCAR